MTAPPDQNLPGNTIEDSQATVPSLHASVVRGVRRHLKAISGIIALAASVGLVLKGLLGFVDTYNAASSLLRKSSLKAVIDGKSEKIAGLSIVVLPFRNLNKDQDQDFFVDGLTEDLTTDISHLAGSFVIARNTAFTYKYKDTDIKTIGRDLGVRYVLEGSVRRSEDLVVLNARLLESATGGQIWADRLEGSRAKLGELQTDFLARLSRSLDVELTQAESIRAVRERPTNPEASDLAMRGWAFLNKPRIPANSADARKAFEDSLQIDPSLLQGMIGLARALSQQVLIKASPNPVADLKHADDLIDSAIQRDPSSAMAHYVKADILRAQKLFEQSLEQSRAAIDINPNFAAAYAQSALTLIYAGRSADSFAFTEKALRLSPRDPIASSWEYFMCHANTHLARWDATIEWCNKSVAHAPYWPAYVDVAAANAWKGNKEAATNAVGQILKLMPGYTVQKWAHADWSNNPTFLSEYQRITEGLRKAGLPEG